MPADQASLIVPSVALKGVPTPCFIQINFDLQFTLMSTGSKIFLPNVFLLIASKKAVVLCESTLKIFFNTAYVRKSLRK